jgi:hypothetical protein
MVRANLSTFPFAHFVVSNRSIFAMPKMPELPLNIWFEPHDFVWEHTWKGAYYDEAQKHKTP